MTSANDKLLQKIGLLLDKAENLKTLDPSFWPEADSCVEKAHELLSKYQLELSDVILMKENRPVEALITHETRHIPGNYNAVKEWRKTLAFAAGRFSFCKAYALGSYRIMMAGRPTDIAAAFRFWESWMTQLESMCEHDALIAYNEGILGSPRHGKVHGRTWRQNYLIAASKMVDSRVYEVVSRRQIELGLTAIVVSTESQIEDYEKANFKKVTIYEPQDYYREEHALRAGFEAGTKIHLGDELNGQTSKHLKS